MLTQETPLQLETLADGAAIERFNDALQQVLDNIINPDTSNCVREVVLKVKLKPNQDKTFIDISLDCIAKPAPASTIVSNAYVGRGVSGRAEAHEIRKTQIPLIDNVVPIRKEDAR